MWTSRRGWGGNRIRSVEEQKKINRILLSLDTKSVGHIGVPLCQRKHTVPALAGNKFIHRITTGRSSSPKKQYSIRDILCYLTKILMVICEEASGRWKKVETIIMNAINI